MREDHRQAVRSLHGLRARQPAAAAGKMEPEMTTTAKKTPPGTLPKPLAVVFDWDDTLVDNWATALTSMNATLTHMGMQPWSDEEARRHSGPSARDMFQKLFGARWEEADKVYYDTFCSLVLKNVRVHDNALQMLQVLADNGVYLAVVSNKRGPLLRQEVGHLGFDKYFAKVIGAGDAAADKPDPAPLIMALDDSGVAAGPEVWFMGDSHTDMRCALDAGCTPVLIETKTPPEDLLIKNPPAARFQNHAQIMELLAGYFAQQD
ncbi:MAG: HAD hydrolase-like protein [Alphaproteobacteria bacterium]|nr:HAD hydrolase-like protein [Alphaproteobacteria bacterium]